MKDLKDRLKSKIVWVSILAQVIGVMTLYAPELADGTKVIAMAVIEIATLIGVLNNPTDKVNW